MYIYSLITILIAFIASNVKTIDAVKYEPNWDSLDTRPLPTWFDKAKIGIFLHWGVFSVPSFRSEWFWYYWKDNDKTVVEYMKDRYQPDFSYQEFAKDFTAEFFNATEWAQLFAKSGAKYVVLTTKHHEGYTLWPSKYSYSWNSQDIGPRRDIVGELSEAVRNQNLVFGTYHSLYEWFNPMYDTDRASNWTKKEFINNKIIPEMHELVETYKPEVFWSDGEAEAPDTYWDSTEFLAWLYNDSPVKDTVVVNDRWGIGTPCVHGDFFSCADRYNPGALQPHKWENAMTIDRESWGFRRNAKLSDYFTTPELISEMASTVSCGGNILINIGPTKDGVITPIFEERLTQLGQWLSINGDAIYETQPWTAQNDTLTEGVWYTSKDGAVYAIVLQWPVAEDTVALASPLELFREDTTVVSLLGNEDEPLKWTINNDAVHIVFPDKSTITSEWAWVLKIEAKLNSV